jgi:dTDP-4-amino-4,6-dideoxygalactose transaminase
MDIDSKRVEVPFLDINTQNASIRGQLQSAVEEVIYNGEFILGPAVERFEKTFAHYIGTAYCVGVNNGTNALHLALLACGVGPGDEVITTPLSWISTAWAISYVGARPVFVDIDPTTYTLDAKLVQGALTSRTRAIVPVHLYGQSADLEPLNQIARDRKLALIEDVSQAHGGEYQNRKLGSFGKVACFSFYPAKNMGAFGEAGALVTSDSWILERLRCLRDQGQRGRHHHVAIGYNMRMEGIQAAILDIKLRHLDSWNAKRAQHAKRYQELLANVPGLVLPATAANVSHAWHLYVVLARGIARHNLSAQLASLGVGTMIHYPTLIPFQPAYASLGYQHGDFPVAQDIARHCLSLPMYPELNDSQVTYSASCLWKIMRGADVLVAA